MSEPQDAVDLPEVVAEIPGRPLGLIVGGFLVGAGLGGGLGYIFCKRQLETKYAQITADEVAEMRQHYNDKVQALDNAVKKTNLEDIVRENGYQIAEESDEPPMAVTPPTAVVEAAEAAKEEVEPTVEKEEAVKPPEPETRNVFRDHGPKADDTWDFHRERSQRSPLRPYVIHRDERNEMQAYEETTLTYYAADDVLCDERDDVINELERDKMIGEENLEKFGHGSGDATIVYIRNNQLEVDFEVVKSPNSYTEEVHGFQHADMGRRRRERSSFDDE